MPRHEYKVIPAPRRGTKSREAKTSEDRFALTLSNVMNDLGRDGWEYVRAETLPTEERAGFTKTRVVEQTVLIFRRSLAGPGALVAAPAEPGALRLTAAEAVPTPRLGPAVEPVPGPAPTLGRAE
ncbi:DUF4177 domain-containing protein [Tabrizicola sp. TH137]|uniref:DUF4177 domain-containing protein n=1 Tax=Tabrizicola sp. TH137 TaxID=2067452 RepID=UPI000C7E1D7E|nr:DUF4177 domain-containing protein [Tabrizicola sp. TH137]PLL12997.1 DUF4177 domain-containing protein [Tabrizicola sp. TH137]